MGEVWPSQDPMVRQIVNALQIARELIVEQEVAKAMKTIEGRLREAVSQAVIRISHDIEIRRMENHIVIKVSFEGKP